MKRKRMDQVQLAEALGVSRSAVNSWVNDRAYPMNSIMGALEDVLGVSLEDEEPSGFQAVSDELRQQIAQVLKDDPEAQRRVIGLLEGTMSWPEGDDAPAQERSAR